MDFVTVFIWGASVVSWVCTGSLVLVWMFAIFPDEVERTCGHTLFGGLFCIALWPWFIAVVLTLTWSRRRETRRRYG
jgi:Zn-dependent protease with chaperone function